MTASDAPAPAEPIDAAIVGRDGAVTLILALLVAAAGLGIPFLLRLIEVARAGWTAPTGPAPAGGRILVLGARLPRDGRPGHAFRARLARAKALHADNPAAPIIVLGGAPTPDRPTEAAAGRAWLRANGVPVAAIHMEERSRHTLENLRCYRAGFAPASGPVLLVTSRCHLARARRMAVGLGLAVIPCAAETRRGAAFHPWNLPREALLLHWYQTGSIYADLTRNRAMLARIRWTPRPADQAIDGREGRNASPRHPAVARQGRHGIESGGGVFGS